MSTDAARQNRVIRIPFGAKPDLPVSVPSVKKEWDWHPLALDWYRSLKLDGQAVLYEPSHWRVARYVAQLMSDELSVPPADRTAARLKVIFDLLKQLYGTPDALQRARIEVHRMMESDEPEPEHRGPTPERIEELKKIAARAL